MNRKDKEMRKKKRLEDRSKEGMISIQEVGTFKKVGKRQQGRKNREKT